MRERTYNLRELIRETAVTERTVRYYIKEGLLPPPHGSGPFSRYGYEHWLRLQFIRRLKDEYLPLSEIKNLLDGRSTAELDQLARQSGFIPAQSGEVAPKGQPSAQAPGADQLQSLIGGGPGRARLLREQMAPASAPWPSAPAASFQAQAGSLGEEPEVYAASFAASAAPAPGSAPDIDIFADVPEAASLSFSGVGAGNDEDLYDADRPSPENVMPPYPSPYSPPGAVSRSFPAASFRAGAAPGSAPGTSGGATGGAGRMGSTPPGSAGPFPRIRLSRFAASQISNDLATDAVSERPGENEAIPPQPPVPAAQPLMAKMAFSANGPVVAKASMPESESTSTVTGRTWERLEVAPGVELHIEKRIADAHRPALANLLEMARRLFGNKEIAP